MIVLIAGTTIGGGTLSLPAAASAPGFFPSVAALLTCFTVLFLEGCLMVEVTVRMKAEGSAREGEPVSFEHVLHSLSWWKTLNDQEVDLGKGKRVIEKGGRLDKRYWITVPASLYQDYPNDQT